MFEVLGFVAIFAIVYLLQWNARIQTDLESFPRRLFQTWKLKTDIPVNMAYWQATWRQHHPGWSFDFWDDADNRAFVAAKFPWFLPTYDAYPKEINRADVVRYCYMYEYGGVYADMDFECLKPLDPLLKQFDRSANLVLGSMDTLIKDRHHSVPNAILISKPLQEFWLSVLKECQRVAARGSGSVEALTGPVLLKSVANQWRYRFRSDIKILEPKVLYPLSWSTAQPARQATLRTSQEGQESLEALTKGSLRSHPFSYTITYWTHSW